MRHTEFSDDAHSDKHEPAAYYDDQPPLAVQILGIIAFGAFSIVAVALAFAAFWVAGMVVAIMLAMTWARTRTFGGKPSKKRNKGKKARQMMEDVAPNIMQTRSSGNSSFDAYRTEMLERLEQESKDFEGFLVRLRAASDAAEFDQFMDDRAKKSRKKLDAQDAEIILDTKKSDTNLAGY